MSHRNSLSIIILTYNEEDNIEKCLDSLQDVNCPVFVVDSYSSDRTIQILENRNVAYTQHPFESYSHQRNWAQENNLFQTEWVFHIDAGERFTPELVDWLNNHFNPDTEIDGYLFSRRILFFDKWVKYGGCYPNYHLRLYRQDKGKCEDKLYDQHFVVKGITQEVKAGVDIIDTFASSIKSFTAAHNRWATFEAAEIIAKNYQAGEVKADLMGNAIEKRRWFKNNIFQKTPLFLRSFIYFIYRYVFRLGFLDGRVGLMYHFLQGFWFRFLIDSLVYEYQRKTASNPVDAQTYIKKEFGIDLGWNSNENNPQRKVEIKKSVKSSFNHSLTVEE